MSNTPTFSFQIRQMLEQINFIENQLDELEEQITTMLFGETPVITTISGISNILGAIIISEIGDISRFDSATKLVAFAGLYASVNKISKRGSPYLRSAIWTAANRASFCDPVLSDYYQPLKARGKHHSTAVGAVA